MRITGTLLALAKRSNALAHSRIWVMLPGAESTVSVSMVCMESIITRSGALSLIWSNIFSMLVSHNTDTLSFLPPSMRSARILSWCALSSPLTYSTSRSGIRMMVCSVSVLLPMPGSPPNRIMLPGTSPPPSTRFSSSSCMSMRGASLVGISFSNMALLREPIPCLRTALTSFAALRALCCPASLAMRISLKVFHCPHDGHLPIHLADSCPQLSQTYAILSFAIYNRKINIFFLYKKGTCGKTLC